MIQIGLAEQTHLTLFWLGVTKIMAIFILIPPFDRLPMPASVKTLTVIVITYAFYDTIKGAIFQDYQIIGEDHFWILTLYYALEGLFIGTLVKMIMMAFVGVGGVIGQSMGFGAMRYFDPNFGGTLGPIEKLLSLVLVALIVSSGALLPLFKGMTLAFTHFGIASIQKYTQMGDFLLNFFKNLFAATLMLAAPMVVTNLLVTFIMGMTSRTIPQLNILMVSFIVNIGIGLVIFNLISNEFFYQAFKIYTQFLGQWYSFLKI